MQTEQWVKKLGGHAGELYVEAELSKGGVPNSLLPENFSDDDLLAGSKNGAVVCFIQVKACHPDRSRTFILRATDEKWCSAPANEFVVFVCSVQRPRTVRRATGLPPSARSAMRA